MPRTCYRFYRDYCLYISISRIHGYNAVSLFCKTAFRGLLNLQQYWPFQESKRSSEILIFRVKFRANKPQTRLLRFRTMWKCSWCQYLAPKSGMQCILIKCRCLLHLMVKTCKIPNLHIFVEIIYELTFPVSRQILPCINFVAKVEKFKVKRREFFREISYFRSSKSLCCSDRRNSFQLYFPRIQRRYAKAIDIWFAYKWYKSW